jgi:hypothetical protein
MTINLDSVFMTWLIWSKHGLILKIKNKNDVDLILLKEYWNNNILNSLKSNQISSPNLQSKT